MLLTAKPSLESISLFISSQIENVKRERLSLFPRIRVGASMEQEPTTWKTKFLRNAWLQKNVLWCLSPCIIYVLSSSFSFLKMQSFSFFLHPLLPLHPLFPCFLRQGLMLQPGWLGSLCGLDLSQSQAPQPSETKIPGMLLLEGL